MSAYIFILDGSKICHNFNNTAGAGIYSKLFCSYISLGPNSTHFDGELEAINSALKQLFYHINLFNKAVIFSDSKSALQAIYTSVCTTKRTAEIYQSIKHLQSLHKLIVLQWIPSHCGILGNEKADALAKKLLHPTQYGFTTTFRY